jgi:hypothetical protein
MYFAWRCVEAKRVTRRLALIRDIGYVNTVHLDCESDMPMSHLN